MGIVRHLGELMTMAKDLPFVAALSLYILAYSIAIGVAGFVVLSLVDMAMHLGG